MPVPTVRPRRDEDLPVLAELLGKQQAGSSYPFRWPLPFPVEQFLVREDEQAAWVCEVDGAVAGHVAVGSVPGAGEPAATFRAGSGCADPALVSVLFTGTQARGTGVGGLLLDTAVAWAWARGRAPVLDVVQRHGDALAVYRHRGWTEIGRFRFDWLPEDEPDVLLMTLPEHRTRPSARRGS